MLIGRVYVHHNDSLHALTDCTSASQMLVAQVTSRIIGGKNGMEVCDCQVKVAAMNAMATKTFWEEEQVG